MINYIIKDLAEVFRYLPYGMVAGIIVAILLSAINDRRVRHNKKPVPAAAWTCFFMYLVIIIFITFLSREGGSRKGIDLELFSTWGINARNNAFVVENVLLFIPFGFTCAWALKSARHFLVCTLYGLLASCSIEFMQLFTQRGYFQVDDILTNVLGTCIGFVLFRCILTDERANARKARYVYIILAGIILVFTVLGIIVYSGDNPAQPSEVGRKMVVYMVNRMDQWMGLDMNGTEIAAVTKFLIPVARQLAHASKYAALAIVIGFGYQMMKRNRARIVNFFYAVLMCAIIALADEALQKFVFHGTGRLMDILVNFTGAVIGSCVFVFLSEFFAFLAGEDSR